jgi:hypothetical protein
MGPALGLTLETRHPLRSEESRPILERIKVSIEAARIGALPQSARTKAYEYTLASSALGWKRQRRTSIISRKDRNSLRSL